MGTRRCVVDRDKVEEMLRRHNGKDGRWTMRLKVLLTVVADILVITSRNWKLKRLGLVKCLLTIGCHRSHSVSIARAILRVLRWHAVGGRTNLGPVADWLPTQRLCKIACISFINSWLSFTLFITFVYTGQRCDATIPVLNQVCLADYIPVRVFVPLLFRVVKAPLPCLFFKVDGVLCGHRESDVMQI